MHVLQLPALAANASADQAEAWLAAFAEARMPTAKELAESWLVETAQLRSIADTARRGAADASRSDLCREVLTLIAARAEALATDCIRNADDADPLPF